MGFSFPEIDIAWGQSVTRGPYLQLATPTSIKIRWRTDVETGSRVQIGHSTTTLDANFDDTTLTTEHEVSVTGLSPGTKYYYSIGTTNSVLQGGDSDHHFATPASTGTTNPVRVWVVGDAGASSCVSGCSAYTDYQEAVKTAYLSYTGAQYTSLMLMLGDNAYYNGTDSEYQVGVFDMYSSLLKQTPIWATLGNHDAFSSDSSSQSGPYYDVFSFPKNAEAGGVASGTEAYYSFDYGNIHFICLDSEDSDRSLSGAMMTWLESDLAQTDEDWIIAFFHHPPYSKGHHDSDLITQPRLTDMREIALPILENYGVDLVLSGHSHSYERSYFLNGHYGTSDTLINDMILNNGNGREDGDGAYRKPINGSNKGAVYIVAGSSGMVINSSLDHPAMHSSIALPGSVILDIDGYRLYGKFIDNNGVIQDYFEVDKSPEGLLSAVPTLSQWGMIVFALILLFAGVRQITVRIHAIHDDVR